jgi:PAS domain S-box-containing protein
MRFTDNDTEQPALLDFMSRNRSRPTFQIVLAFICAIAAISASRNYAVTETRQDTITFFVCLLLTVVGIATLYFRKRADDLVLATEFQNLLYASAASIGFQFCLISKRDGTAVHCSDGLSKLFDGFPYPVARALEGFFAEGRVAKIDQDKITDTLLMNERKSLVVKLSAASGISDMVLTIDPLPRPHGYYMIRGRYFRGDRGTGSVLLGDISPEIMRHLLEESPVGHFICDEFGRFEYINPALAALIGLTPQTIVEDRLTIPDLFSQKGGKRLVQEYEYRDMKEDVILTSRTGLANPVHLELSLIQDAGKVVAIVGTITQG